MTHPALLTAEEEADLARRSAAGDTGARDLLVERNLGLVKDLALKMRPVSEGMGLDELIQEGVVGLLQAIRNFDPDRGRLTTIAHPWIWGEMVDAIRRNRFIRLPCHVHTQVNRARRGELPEEDERRVFAIVARTSVRSLDKRSTGDKNPRINMDSDGISLHCALPDRDTPDPHEAIWDRDTVRAALRALPKDERMVLYYRFGFDGHPHERTFREVGAILGISHEWARQLDHRAMARLKGQPELEDVA